VDHKLEVIRDEMEQTRSSLADKLEALESEFRGTVEGATTAVANTVEAVEQTVENVKDSVKETVETVKDTFNVRRQVERYPWAMFGGAFLVGSLMGGLLGRSHRRRRESAPAETPSPTPPEPARNGGYRNGSAKKQSQEAKESDEGGPFRSSFEAIKGLAVGTLMGTLRDVLVNAVPSNLADDLAGVVDDLTTRLGGKPLRHAEETDEHDKASEGETHHDGSEPAEMGRPLGATRWSR
jgi:ElaB/YqjD/DUF883 family membrane-anchored ribosome-binding protein